MLIIIRSICVGLGLAVVARLKLHGQQSKGLGLVAPAASKQVYMNEACGRESMSTAHLIEDMALTCTFPQPASAPKGWKERRVPTMA